MTARVSEKTVLYQSEMRGCSAKVFQTAGAGVPGAANIEDESYKAAT